MKINHSDFRAATFESPGGNARRRNASALLETSSYILTRNRRSEDGGQQAKERIVIEPVDRI